MKNKDSKTKLDGKGQRHAIIVSSWNEFITERLHKGVIESLEMHGVEQEKIDSFHVPGAFELGPSANEVAKLKRYDAITCVACVIRGATPHFEYVSSQAARLIAQCSFDHGIPVLFGVLTTDTVEQAIERAGTKAGNKGFEAGMSAIQMVNLYREIKA